MKLIYTKTNKLKIISKIRQKYFNNYNPSEFVKIDANATHFQILDENNQIVGCASYYFSNKIINIYMICSPNELKNEIINYIKNSTKQFNCTYICK